MGEMQERSSQLSFNSSLKVDFQGSRVTSDGGLILVRELDEHRVRALPRLAALTIFLATTVGLVAPALAQWSGFARNPQHTAQSPIGSQALNRIIWSTAVDLQPQLTAGELLIHYGSPLITAANTVIVPVKTSATGAFRVDARDGANGNLIWSLPTGYVPPPQSWTPVFGPALTSKRLYFPGAGGTVYFRDQPDSICSGHGTCQGQLAFYGIKKYRKTRSTFDARVQINTPLTTDRAGNIYFGFLADNFGLKQPLTDVRGRRLTSGVARISRTGKGNWVAAAAAAADQSMDQVVTNCAPALSTDLQTLYVAVSNGSVGYLVALDSSTLAPKARVRLIDPLSGIGATLSNNTSASPTVGPDGDVYFGVLENPCCIENHDRGWLLHFDSSLSQSKTTGAFGYDTTVSIVPISAVPSYSGQSSYLLLTKYNNYANAGGDGLNKIALLDPSATETDPVTGVSVMNEVDTIVGPTPNDDLPGVKEWCINSAAVDPATGSILANNEDGTLYRWLPSTNTLSESIVLTPGIGEAYTPTVIGTDGTVYAINNATLFAVGN